MEIKEFESLKKIKSDKYENIDLFELADGSLFYIEPNFYTQLLYVKDHFLDKFPEIIDKIIEIAKRNKKMIFTADFENPVVYVDDFYYREIGDVLGELGLHFDNKGNPDSDWKD